VSDRPRLLLLSFLMLFIELALIRWLGSNVVYLSYFSNFVLLGSFLGIGIGFLRARSKFDSFRYAPVALAVLVAFVIVFPVEIDRSGSDLIYFGVLTTSGLPTWVTLPVIFLAVAAIMAMIGEGVARAFVAFPPLEAYRLDIGGSILGIVAFSALSFAWAPPVAWGVVAAVVFLFVRRTGWLPLQLVALAAVVFVLGRESALPFNSWSPYYKVSVTPIPDGRGIYDVAVNGIPHQSIQTVALRKASNPEYFLPYERLRTKRLDNILIVGAGTGSDVAIALSEGAKHVVAVEIDPRLQQLGSQLHANEPYQDPRVEVHIDDGRAFLERTHDTYDLILFALPDSLTLVQGQSSLRLESYLFTQEAMASARAHLKPTGVFSMYNYYRESWLVERLAGTLAAAYGHAPCVDSVGQRGRLAVLTTGLAQASAACAGGVPATIPASAPSPTHDDYPFLYLRDRGIPAFYLLAIALILAASTLLIRAAGGPLRVMGGYVDLFFMGAAFLLLETKGVVQFALLFGTTWFVNALVFAGILLSVLAAIEVTRRVHLPGPQVLYAVLLLLVLASLVIPADALLGLDPNLRFIGAIGLWFTPIFVANLIFAQRFEKVGASNVAFGANLLGAMVGGVLEYISLITGYQLLAIAVAVLYSLAYVTGRRHLARASVAEPAGAPLLGESA
jgi:SAM-dependent methyltransferase